MERDERAARNFIRADEMRDVAALIFLAHQAFARRIDRAFLAQQRRFIEIHAPFVRRAAHTAFFIHERDAAPRVMRRHGAIERVHAPAHHELNILRMPDAEQMPRLFCRQKMPRRDD